MSENIKGMLLMSCAMLCFTLGDMTLKWVSTSITSGQILLALGLGGLTLFTLLLRRQGKPLFSKIAFEPPILIRTIGETLATICIIIALTYTNFSLVTAVIQTLPLLLTLASLFFLGEKVGYHRLLAVCVGFLGMILVLKPGGDHFNIYTLFAIAGVLCMGARDLGARLAAPHHSSISIAVYGYFGQTLAGVGFLLFEDWQWPTLEQSILLLVLIGFSTLGVISLTKAMRTGDISAVSPLRYTRLLFGLAGGYLVFNERMDFIMGLGAGLILISGLYVWYRERLVSEKN